jgi:hypothetical protein
MKDEDKDRLLQELHEKWNFMPVDWPGPSTRQNMRRSAEIIRLLMQDYGLTGAEITAEIHRMDKEMT